MIYPIGDLLRRFSGSERKFRFIRVRMDSKGRISIPAFLRRNYSLEQGSGLRLVFNIERNFIILDFGQDGVSPFSLEKKRPSGSKETAFQNLYGQDGVNGSMRGCGPLSPGSNAAAGAGDFSRAENPGPDPYRRGDRNGRT